MTKKAIWQIVLLVSIALIGILGMQIYSIVSSYRLNKELFDNKIHNALDHIVSKLEQREIEETANKYNLPVLTSIRSNDSQQLATIVEIEEISSALESGDTMVCQASIVDTLSMGAMQQITHSFSTRETTRTWKKGNNKKEFMRYFERYFVHHSIVKDIPVQQRISIPLLNEMLKEELSDKGIKTPCAFAVFSNKENEFVINNKVCTEHLKKYKEPGMFKYSASLFPSSHEQVAKIYLDFPSEINFLWSELWFSILSTILFTGIVIFCFSYTINIILTQKKLSEMKNDFLNNMTHEFKTPIATITIATDTIKQWLKKGQPDKALRFVNIIEEENKRMNSQVGKVLQMARIDKREFKLNLEEVYADDVILNAAEKISMQVDQKGGKVDLELNATNSVLEADETHFTNIIHNLLDNANKYSPDKPHITICTKNVASGLQIAIKDNGLGISKEARKHIFDKFYRVPTGNLHDIKGFGLGLSYVQAIVVAHGGTIEVQSELGKGSTFIMTFPHIQNKQNEDEY